MLCVIDQRLADTDAVTSPAEDDASRAKKSLFVSGPSIVDTTSGSDSVHTAEDGRHFVTYW